MGDIKRRKKTAEQDHPKTEPTLMENPYYSVKTASQVCGMGMETVRAAIQSGELRASRFLSMTNGSPSQQSRYLIRDSDLKDWIDRRTVPA